MKSFLVAMVLAMVGSFGFSYDKINDFDVAIETARTEEKNVLVIFTLDKCHYCDVLKSDMDSLKNINNYIVCILDSRSNKKLTGKMGIKKWPTSIIFSVGKETQGEASRVVGYGDKAEYDNWLKLNAEFFGADDACGCDCDDDCSCRKNGICTCCGDKCDCCECKCDKDCVCKKNGKCSCKKGKCTCKR